MTQTVSTVSSYSVIPTNPAGSITRTIDDSIVVTGWSTPIAVTDDSTFTTVAGTGKSIAVQFSPDGTNWSAAAAVPYSGTFTGGVPPGTLWIRAQGIGATGTLTTNVPVAWTNLTSAQVARAITSKMLATRLLKPDGIICTPGSAATSTLSMKVAIPADATHVALVPFHTTTGHILNIAAASVCVTETMYLDAAAADRYKPYVFGSNAPGGVSLDTATAIDLATTIYGWRTVTWAGASTVALADPVDEFTPTYSISDYVPLPDLPPSVADINAGSALGYPADQLAKFRYVMFRVYIDGSAGNTYTFSAFTENSAYSTYNKGFTRRQWISSSTGDRVTAAGAAINGSFSSVPTQGLPWAIAYRTASQGKTIIVSGDSLVQNNGVGTNAELRSPWVAQACFAAGAADGRAWSYLNFGCSNHNMADYYAPVAAAITAFKPTAYLLAAASRNDTHTGTLLEAQQYFQQLARGRCMEFIAACNAVGTRPILMTQQPVDTGSIPSSALGKTIDNERVIYNNWIRNNFGIYGSADVFDLDGILTDNGTVDAFGVYRIRAGLTPDGIHQNPAGNALIVAAFAALLNTL